MAFYDRARALDAKFLAKYGVPATLKTKGADVRDRIKNSVTPAAPITKAIIAKPGKRTLKAEDGTLSVQAILKLDTAAKSGDRIAIGTNTYTVGEVTEHAPDGGIPYHWIVTVK